MTPLASRDVLERTSGGLKARIQTWAAEPLPLVLGVLRTVWPIPHLCKTAMVTRYDDVREVFLNDACFGVPYGPKLSIITGGQPFFLTMGDTPEYRTYVNAMRKVVVADDIPRLAKATEDIAEGIVASSGGRIEVVNDLVRRVTFEVFADYFGIPNPPNGDLRVWATRLFHFQFADLLDSRALRADVDEIAPALRDHIQKQIDERRASRPAKDDVLGRCLKMQASGDREFSNERIRTALMAFIVGGPPQPPIVVPQALEQLLRRPEALTGAQEAARNDDDRLLAGYVFEAMRFDPLALGLFRVARKDCTIAAGTPRATEVAKGTRIFVAFSSAMRDGRRLPDPTSFNPGRLPHEYIHFGYGLHTCFAIHINQVVLLLMLKPLLKRPGLRRARGLRGRLSKRDFVFADRLWVEYD